ncbi:MAG: hypothetical protein HYU88_12820 [Chloroflexi bacterium]|nr:hypothetical protein [Chloroflexota bacterium]MBI4507326.1 hypothetical protein [Chloroflexota bacterium]
MVTRLRLLLAADHPPSRQAHEGLDEQVRARLRDVLRGLARGAAGSPPTGDEEEPA